MAGCYDCEKWFHSGSRARDQHCEATGHLPAHLCDTCNYIFTSKHASYQHMRAKGHFVNGDSSSISCNRDFPCEVCDSWYRTDKDCDDHMIDDHYYCRDCGPGLTHHVETGSCVRAPHLDRRELYWHIRDRDVDNAITKYGVPPRSSDDMLFATEESWCDGGYMCDRCDRVFTKLDGLNQHLNSPAHQNTLYCCPELSCGAEFKTLAATINHLESEACGAMTFEKVRRKIGDIISGDRLLRF
ncbi:hypothetical protein B0J18DRAFT_484424 [Chaetomium sp. MPI-SDFR-AT-0129]|nr:hypothetical protein B0J18DRAFT_484424 [Chaetomium sp. MPI-SDFR-AT-0129]